MSDLSPHALTTTPAADAAAPDLPCEVLAAFVQTLAQWGNVRSAAQQVGVSRAHLYRMRRASPEFRQLWDAALVLARPQVEEVLADRALNGVAETVFYHGEEVATRIRYDGRLLLAHLARLDRIESSHQVRSVAADFDARVAQLLAPPVLTAWDDDDDEDDDDDDYAEDAGEDYDADGDDPETDEDDDSVDWDADAASDDDWPGA